MKTLILMINLIIGLGCVEANTASNYKGSNLLSYVGSSWNLTNLTGIGLNPSKCMVDVDYYYHKSPNMTTYGIYKNYTAVLTGYPMNQPDNQPRQNKGVIYGWNDKVKPYMNGKASFLFYSDFAVEKLPKGKSEEFCCHIYVPPLKVGPSVKQALGAPNTSVKRNFGSDEKLDEILRKESGNRSKRVSSCCFVIQGRK